MALNKTNRVYVPEVNRLEDPDVVQRNLNLIAKALDAIAADLNNVGISSSTTINNISNDITNILASTELSPLKIWRINTARIIPADDIFVAPAINLASTGSLRIDGELKLI